MTHGNLTKMACINSNLLPKTKCSWILNSYVIVTKLIILSFTNGKKHEQVYLINVLQDYTLSKIIALIRHQMQMKSYMKQII